jgi:hypothetical protein
MPARRAGAPPTPLGKLSRGPDYFSVHAADSGNAAPRASPIGAMIARAMPAAGRLRFARLQTPPPSRTQAAAAFPRGLLLVTVNYSILSFVAALHITGPPRRRAGHSGRRVVADRDAGQPASAKPPATDVPPHRAPEV